MFIRILCCMSLGCLVPSLSQARDIPLKDTSVAHKILDAIPTFGNNGHNDLESLTVTPDGLSVSGTIRITASHKWGSWFNPVTLKDEDVSATRTISFEFKYDLQTNKLSGTADFGTVRLLPGVLGFNPVEFDIRVDVDKIEGCSKPTSTRG